MEYRGAMISTQTRFMGSARYADCRIIGLHRVFPAPLAGEVLCEAEGRGIVSVEGDTPRSFKPALAGVVRYRIFSDCASAHQTATLRVDGKRVARTLSMRRPSRSITSKRQP